MGGYLVAHTSPGSDKSGDMAVTRVQWDTMVPVPCVTSEAPSIGGDSHGLAEGRFRVVGLSLCGSVDLPEVDYPPGLSRFLPHHVHAAAPGGRGIAGYSLEHTECDVLLEFLADLVQPMGRDSSWLVDSDRFCAWFQEKA